MRNSNPRKVGFGWNSVFVFVTKGSSFEHWSKDKKHTVIHYPFDHGDRFDVLKPVSHLLLDACVSQEHNASVGNQVIVFLCVVNEEVENLQNKHRNDLADKY